MAFPRTTRLRALAAAAAALVTATIGPLAAAPARASVPSVVPTSCAGLAAPTADGIACQSVAVTAVSSTATTAGGGTVAVPAGWFVDVTMTSTAIFVPAPSGATPTIHPVAEPLVTRIWLPAGYDPGRATGYQTLYLLHGGNGQYNDWADSGHIVQNTAGSPFHGVYVMPAGGLAGWYSDWPGHTDGFFAPRWETFHTQQLVPWIDANFHTLADRSGRAVAGASMGGFGALKYAADHPDLFSAAGGFSPGTQLTSLWAQSIISNSMWQAGASINYLDALNGNYRMNEKNPDGSIVGDQQAQLCYRLDGIFGPGTGHSATSCPVQGLDWPQVNPTDRAAAGGYAAFAGRLAVYGGGCADASAAGQTDGTQPAPPSCAYPTDNATSTATPPGAGSDWRLAADVAAFDQTLRGQNVGHRYCFGTGGHDWTAFSNDLSDFLEYAYGGGPAARLCGTGA